MELPYDLDLEIKNYCKINNIADVNKFIVKIIKKGFAIEKYGDIPEEVVKKRVNKPAPPVPEKVKEVKKVPKPKKEPEIKKEEPKVITNRGLYDED